MTGGKARSNDESFEAFQLKQNSKFENFMDQNANIDHAQFFTSAPPDKVVRTFLRKGFGGVMGSPIGWNASIVTIDAGAIDIGRQSGKLAGHVIVQAETGTADTLTDIDNFVFSYQDLVIQADAGDTITVDNTGNLFLGDGVTDLTIKGSEMLRLRYDILLNKWGVFLGGEASGGGGVSFPITPPVDVRGDVSTTQAIVLTDTDAHSTTMTLTDNIAITFSGFPSSGTQIEWEVEITQDGTGGHVITWPGVVLNPPVLDTTANTTTVIVFRTNDGGTIVRVGNTVTTVTNIVPTNQIGQNDSSVTVTDTGSNGNVITIIDSIQRYSIQADRVDFAVADIFGLQTLNFDGTLGASTITPSTSGVVWNFPTSTDKLSIDFAGSNGIAISAANTIFYSGTPLSLSAAIRLYRNETVGVPAAGDAVGSVHFDGNDISDTLQEYALINGGIRGVSAGSEEGSLVFQVATGGTLADIMDIDSGEVIIKTLLNMDTHKISGLVDPTADQEAATKKYVDDSTSVQSSIVDSTTTATVLNSAPSFSVVLAGNQKFSISNTRVDYEELDLFGVTQINMNDSGANLISSLSASSSGLVLNLPDDTNTYDIQIDSADAFHVDDTKTLITSTVPGTNPVFLHLFRDTNVVNSVLGEIQFRGNDDNPTNIVYGKIGVELEANPSATSEGSFQWTLRHAGANQDMMSLRDGVLGVSRHTAVGDAAASGAALVLERIDAAATVSDEAGEISFNIIDGDPRTIGVIATTWDNTTTGDNSSRMDFQLETNDALTNILTIRGSAISTGLIAIEISGESYIKAKTGVMGFFTTADPDITDSGIIGSAGTMQIPQFSDGSATVTELNAAFGDFDGAIGQDISDGRLYVRKSTSVWSFYTESGTVTV